MCFAPGVMLKDQHEEPPKSARQLLYEKRKKDNACYGQFGMKGDGCFCCKVYLECDEDSAGILGDSVR